ncbi:MAG TPA: NAD-dependent epimerase/dehydratase family protein, partial [Candidatus Dormibacteraeota bacterium]|nr:NAD-dependent epimerase/dehydratase family protein [Candidatus Dormibacteraeota bacterium]
MLRQTHRVLRVVIPGGSGQVGNILARHFHANGHSVVAFARRPTRAPWRVIPWDGVSPGSWIKELDGADVLINLAGRN